MKFFFDENLPSRLAHALALLEEPFGEDAAEVKHLEDMFERGTSDEIWLPEVGKQGYVVISCDLNIRRRKSQWAICEDSGIAIFFFKPPGKHGYTHWQWVEQVIKYWSEIKKIAEETPRPFACRVTSRSINVL